MYKNISLIILIIVASTATGCAKFRELTRRDYAMLKDPFLDRSAVAKVDEAPEANRNGVSGVVQATDLSATNNAATKTTPVSSTRTVSAESSAKADFKGDFKGVRMNGMGNVINQDGGPSLEDFVGKTPESVAAVAAAVKTPQAPGTDMEDFTQFVKGQAEASGMTNTAQELDEDMNEWFVKQNEEWNQQTQAGEEHAAVLIDPVRRVQEVAIDAHPEMPSLPQLGFGNPSSATKSSNPEIATPLIQQAATTKDRWIVPTTTAPKIASAAAAESNSQPATKSEFAPDPFAAFSGQTADAAPSFAEIQPTSGTKPPAGTTNPNPFAEEFSVAPKPQNANEDQWNPFNSGNRPIASPTPTQTSQGQAPAAEGFDRPFRAKAAAEQPTSDSGFHFDSGWRPTN